MTGEDAIQSVFIPFIFGRHFYCPFSYHSSSPDICDRTFRNQGLAVYQLNAGSVQRCTVPSGLLYVYFAAIVHHCAYSRCLLDRPKMGATVTGQVGSDREHVFKGGNDEMGYVAWCAGAQDGDRRVRL